MRARTAAALGAALLLAAGCGHATSLRGLPQALPGASASPEVEEQDEGDIGFGGQPPLVLGPGPVLGSGDRTFLFVTRDGCTVLRSALPSSVPGEVEWQVQDEDGEAVYAEPAGEVPIFRYDEAGTWTVLLVAVEDGDETEISNEVAVSC